jgi:hypothetical protein
MTLRPFVLDTRSTRDLAPAVMEAEGGPRVLPASFYATTTLNERLMLCVKQALYGLPTEELVAWLARYIAGRSAIEIGAGTGALSRALRAMGVNIRGVDNFLQDRPEVRQFYASIQQPTIRYGQDVEQFDALDVVKALQPKVVIASWFTHKYDPNNQAAGGNEHGVDEAEIVANCDAYVFIGNTGVHAQKPIWKLPHAKIEPEWLFSRGRTGRDFIAVWRRDGMVVDLPASLSL